MESSTLAFTMTSNINTSIRKPKQQQKQQSSLLLSQSSAGEEQEKELISPLPSLSNDSDILKSPNQIPLLMTSTKCIPSQMSPTSLAYIGDVVYEMCIRCRYVWPTRRTSDLQNVVVAKVRAETQSKIYQILIESFPLTKEEQTIVSRGRNAGSPKKKSRGPKRLYGSGASGKNGQGSGPGPSAYQDSTAIEALIGYLYLIDGERCSELLEFVCDILDGMDEEEGISR